MRNKTTFKKGHKVSNEIRKKISLANKGKSHSQTEETKTKISVAHKGKKMTQKQRESYREYWKSKKTQIPWNKGLIMPEQSGKNHPNWKGGKSFEPYPPEFNNKLKLLVKERDKNRCLICKSNRKLSVHHIDYNKNNCDPANLITLCGSCHSTTNYNREFWRLVLSKGTNRIYKESLAYLIDRLSITTLKSIFLGCKNKEKKEAYEEEAKEIMNDMHLIMTDKKDEINHWGIFIRAILVNMNANLTIWANETLARAGGRKQDHLLPFTHSVNSVRMRAGNVISNQLGERKDLNLDRLVDDVCLKRGYDFNGLFS